MNEVQTADVRGDVYEYLLSKIAQSGRNGQFETPRHIIRMMVEMIIPMTRRFCIQHVEHRDFWLPQENI